MIYALTDAQLHRVRLGYPQVQRLADLLPGVEANAKVQAAQALEQWVAQALANGQDCWQMSEAQFLRESGVARRTLRLARIASGHGSFKAWVEAIAETLEAMEHEGMDPQDWDPDADAEHEADIQAGVDRYGLDALGPCEELEVA